MTRSESFLFRLKSAVKNRLVAFALLFLLLLPGAHAQTATRLIIQVQGGLPVAELLCKLLGCTVQYGLGDPQGEVFLVTTPLSLPLNLYLAVPGVLDVELDQVGKAMDTASQGTVPSALYNNTPVNYYGTPVIQGYLTQPAAGMVGLPQAQSTYKVGGSGIVAVVDTGVDPTHPVLQRVLLQGYDFTRNQAGANELLDLNGAVPGETDQSTVAVLDASTAAYLNQPQYQDFGHGTMVSGVIHLVAPTAMILPLKAFGADGSGYLSNVLRAIYYAVGQHARALNMSFNFASPSQQLNRALTYASTNGVISAAAAGNSGKETLVYPAAYQSLVMGVASVSDNETLSTYT